MTFCLVIFVKFNQLFTKTIDETTHTDNTITTIIISTKVKPFLIEKDIEKSIRINKYLH